MRRIGVNNQSAVFYLPYQKHDTFANIITNMAGSQIPMQLMNLVTHCNEMNTVDCNLT